MSKKLLLVLSSFVLLGLFGFTLIKSQSNKVVCKPATTPWKIEDFAVPNYYIAGYYPNVVITQVCSFRGHVERDQVYKHEVAQGLAFCLRPINYLQYGWNIIVTEAHSENCETDFSSPVTLPMHGWTPRDVLGNYFANQSDTKDIIGSMEKPVAVQEFNFVFIYEDYKRIEENWACWTYGMNCPSNWGNTSETPRSRGVFTITKIKLGNLSSKEQVWIESMDFEVEFYLPAQVPSE